MAQAQPPLRLVKSKRVFQRGLDLVRSRAANTYPTEILVEPSLTLLLRVPSKLLDSFDSIQKFIGNSTQFEGQHAMCAVM